MTSDQFTRDLGSSFRSVRDTVVHIYAAEWIWYQRWRGNSPTAFLPVDQFPDVADDPEAGPNTNGKVRACRGARRGWRRAGDCLHASLSGLSSSSPFWQMLQHVVNHASYHRGQVTTMLRQLGAAPAKSCDMITFYRERA